MIWIPKRVFCISTLVFLVGCSVTNNNSKTKVLEATLPAVSSLPVLRYETVHHPLISRDGMVASQNKLATEVGHSILAQGGNAVDAAIAVGFALAVTLPRAGNIGGSGFMLIHVNGETKALDFRSMAPKNVRTNDFIDASGTVDWEKIRFGPKASGVPGTVAGLHLAWKKYGTMPWKKLLMPAIGLAKDGIIVSDDLAFALSSARPVMSNYPSSMETYFEGGSTPRVGDRLFQANLAQSLQLIADKGSDTFYRGELADRIQSEMEKNGGYITKEDLANYRVKIREPIQTDFNGYKVVTMPPVSGGGVAMLQTLNMLEAMNVLDHPQGSAKSIHLIAESMKRAAANRRINIGDPDFVEVPIKEMLSPGATEKMVSSISLSRATSVKDIEPVQYNPYPSPDTTHYSVTDQFGNAVSTTYTLGYSFGSGFVMPGTGILMDNHIKNFTYGNPGHSNELKPGKRMMSSMAPTLAFSNSGELVLVTGTPGGSRIPNILSQLIVNHLGYGLNIAEATIRPRIHQQWRTPKLGVEPSFSHDSISLLESMGHSTEFQQTMGSTQSIAIKDGFYFASSDPRRPGSYSKGLNVQRNTK